MPLLTDNLCNCDWPVLWEVGNPTFLGRLVRIRLCCLMTDMEQRFETTYHETFDGEPLYKWNEEATGKPIPDYIAKRLAVKKAVGFAMEAPIEPDAARQQRDHPDGDVGGDLPEDPSRFIRSMEPVETGRRKSWQ